MRRSNSLQSALTVLVLGAALLSTAATSANAENGTVGVMVDAGVPDGVNGAIVWRATPRIRLHAGGGFNGFAPGVRGGFSIAVVPFWITPTVNVEAGRYFEGDANVLVQMISGDSSFDEPVLRRIGYDYANAHLGIEMGYSRMTFYVHAGMSTLRMRVHNIDESLSGGIETEDESLIEIRSSALVRVLAPSARAGFVYYF